MQSLKNIDYAEGWFNRYGTSVIFTASFIPVVRHAISKPTGITKMPHIKFINLTRLAVIPWSIVFVDLGFKFGEELENINKVAGPSVKYFAIDAIGCGIRYFV